MFYLPKITWRTVPGFLLLITVNCSLAGNSDLDRAKDAINAIAKKGKWSVSIQKDKLTMAPMVKMVLPADQARVATSLSSATDYAGIVATCMKGRVNLFFVFPDRLVANERVSVAYRIGNAPPKNSSWAGSQSNDAYGPWEGTEAKNILRQALSAEELYIEASTHIYSSTEAMFDLTGLRDSLGENIKECDF